MLIWFKARHSLTSLCNNKKKLRKEFIETMFGIIWRYDNILIVQFHFDSILISNVVWFIILLNQINEEIFIKHTRILPRFVYKSTWLIYLDARIICP